MTAITPAIRPAIGPAIRSAFEGGFAPSLLSQAMAIVRKYGGALYDPSNMASLFQDSAGTIPVTAPGQPVGLMLDLSGNGHHVSQITTTARPLYQIIDGFPCVVGDGVDDFLRTPVQIPAGPDRSTTLMVGARLLSETADFRFLAGAGNGSPARGVGIQRATVAANTSIGYSNYGTAVYATHGGSQPTNITFVFALRNLPDTPLSEFFVNGTAVASRVTTQGTNANGPMTVGLFSNYSGGAFISNSAIFAAAYLPVAATPAEQLVLTRFIASRSGVTL